ncbi:DUF4097 domain-containing protein [Streptomyces sp. A7024]|uniref:DUF4097 domain-containing protein n=2 Tax=Streptomyces coryli TaxID=1128680 RepID=A0A6G4UAP0_9ACTN|nr:DUF4097 domain-containing protein [Streptomyces coryli]
MSKPSNPVLRTTLAAAAAVTVAAVAASCTTVGDGKAEHRTFALPSDAKQLTIETDDSGLTLVPAEDAKTKDVRVTRWFQAKKWNGTTETSWSADGATLRLKTKCSGVVVDCDSRHKVEVPQGLDVKVNGRDGSVRASGLDAKLDIRTVDGSINIQDPKAPLTLNSRDGSVTAEGIKTPDVRATTNDGSLHLAFASTPDRVQTSSRDGSTTLELPGNDPYKIATKLRDGSRHIDVPRSDSSRHTIDSQANDGSITIRAAG